MPIVWRKQISVANDIIDTDHKYLICLINSVELALRHDDALEYLPIYVEQLVDYTREHFAREEAIQKKALYPLQKEHRKEHEEILVRLKDLVAMVADYAARKEKNQIGKIEERRLQEQVLELARRWILEHLLKEDKRMEYYLRKLPPNFQ